MKRSEINAAIERAIAFMTSCGVPLPPFARWSPRQWRRRGPEADEIRDCMLGWDVTDFGTGDFARTGLVLLTLRNGHPRDRRYRAKTYCEKAMVAGAGQVTPMHFHWRKMEDIINRGGGHLVIRFHNATPAGRPAAGPVRLSVDGVTRVLPAGGRLRLPPGESVCIPPRVYHEFEGARGRGPVLAWEVSKVNDDRCDNRFLEPAGRFPAIKEDEPPRHLLCSEYPRARRGR